MAKNQKTGLGNRRHLKVLNDTKLVLNEHEWPPQSFILGSIWYHSESSDVSYLPNQFLALEFFATSCSKTALNKLCLTLCNQNTLLSSISHANGSDGRPLNSAAALLTRCLCNVSCDSFLSFTKEIFALQRLLHTSKKTAVSSRFSMTYWGCSRIWAQFLLQTVDQTCFKFRWLD